MNKIQFLFAVHNHQPLGNFPQVFEQAFSQAYWPFLQMASQYPGFKFALHFTGFLWEFILDKHPEGLELVRQLVKSGQVELLGGGFYEP
ncbi:MAG: 4-alpha-glucanotransferase, partial [Candidatus Aminicenantales bacterium]